MKSSYYRISLDIHNPTSQLSLPLKKGDKNRKLLISLMDNGVPYEITDGCYAIFTAKKQDGSVIVNDCTIKNNLISYHVTEQTSAVSGMVDCEVVLYKYITEDYSEKLTSPSFSIIVHDPVIEGQKVTSTDEYNALVNLIAKGNELVTNVENKLANGDFVGEKGEAGKDGVDGQDGETPYIGTNGNWWVGETDTGVSASGGSGISEILKGETAPSTETVGELGQFYTDTTSGTSYQCKSIVDGVYTWVLFATAPKDVPRGIHQLIGYPANSKTTKGYAFGSYASKGAAGSIAQYNTNGALMSVEPTQDTEAANKKYVDDNKGTQWYQHELVFSYDYTYNTWYDTGEDVTEQGTCSIILISTSERPANDYFTNAFVPTAKIIDCIPPDYDYKDDTVYVGSYIKNISSLVTSESVMIDITFMDYDFCETTPFSIYYWWGSGFSITYVDATTYSNVQFVKDNVTKL